VPCLGRETQHARGRINEHIYRRTVRGLCKRRGRGLYLETSERALEWHAKGQERAPTVPPSQKATLALELDKPLAVEAKKKEAERKSTFQKIEKPSLPVVHAAEQAAKMVGANLHSVTDVKMILPYIAPLAHGATMTKKRGTIMSVFNDPIQIHPLFPNLVTILSPSEELRFQRLLARAETDDIAAAVLRGVWGLLERGDKIGAKGHFMEWSTQYDSPVR
jgi:hypothetical protein